MSLIMWSIASECRGNIDKFRDRLHKIGLQGQYTTLSLEYISVNLIHCMDIEFNANPKLVYSCVETGSSVA